ncbi:CLN3 protein [Ancylostoma duodenale]|uniref:CLN3 protein n=1 Tax=Ancylostoma duodenale TaxID=51022 RepID=A0A0C2GMC9_9BILA|nr:CLN3 protein [Ancylostoma duodenale]
MAGVVGAFSYAGLTDRHLLALSPTEAMMVMLVVPALFMFTEYGEKLPKSPSIASVNSVEMQKTIAQRLTIVKSLLRYMIPLFLTYFAEYLINQGLLELTVFDCAHGYGTSPASQYRWYQATFEFRD